MIDRDWSEEERDFIEACSRLGITESAAVKAYRELKSRGIEIPTQLLWDTGAPGLGRYRVPQYTLPTIDLGGLIGSALFFLPRLVIDNAFRLTLPLWLGLGLLVDGWSKVSGLPWLQSSSRASWARVARSQETDTEQTKRLLEQGDYIEALQLDRNARAVSVRNKVIDLRESNPDLSPLLLQAQDALIKDRPRYEKDCKLRDGICHTLSRRFGKVVLDIYPTGRVWQLARDKPLPANRLHTFVVKEVDAVVARLPPLEKPNRRGKVRAFVGGKDCPDCHDTPPTCSACHGSGKKDRTLEGEELMQEAREHPAMRRRLRHTLLWRLGITRGIGAALYLYFWFLFVSPGSWHVIERIGATGEGPCPICFGHGKHCSCVRAIRFVIPRNARIGSIVEGESVPGERPLDKPAYARLVK